jgi:hypothetical protein
VIAQSVEAALVTSTDCIPTVKRSVNLSRALNSESPLKNANEDVVIDRVERRGHIKQHQRTDVVFVSGASYVTMY